MRERLLASLLEIRPSLVPDVHQALREGAQRRQLVGQRRGEGRERADLAPSGAASAWGAEAKAGVETEGPPELPRVHGEEDAQNSGASITLCAVEGQKPLYSLCLLFSTYGSLIFCSGQGEPLFPSSREHGH